MSAIQGAKHWLSVLPSYESSVEVFRRHLADPEVSADQRQIFQELLLDRETYAGLKIDGDSGPELIRQPQVMINLTYDLKQEIENANHA
jgi:hypothetical protein